MATLEKYSASGKRDGDFNFMAMLIDAFGFPLGSSFLSSTTIIPLFLQRLGASNMVIGLVPAIASLGSFLPQIFVSNRIESLPIKKYYVFAIGMLERLPFLALVPLTLLFAEPNPRLLTVAFLALWLFNSLCMGVNLPAYYALLGKLIPTDRRGRLFGLGGAISGILGLAGAWGAGLALTRLMFPMGFAACFLTGFVILTLTVLPFLKMREPYQARSSRSSAFKDYLTRSWRSIKGNSGLCRYIGVQILFAFGTMSIGFFTIHSLRNLGATTAEVAIFNGISLAAGTLANFGLGYIADHMGHKRVVELSALAGCIGAVIAALTHSVAAMYLVFAVTAVSTAGYGLSGIMIILDFAPKDEVPTYTAVSSTITAPFRFAAPLLAGWLADAHGYSPVFAFSVAASVGAWIILRWFIAEPRVAPASDAICTQGDISG